MRILGLCFGYHDAAAALLIDVQVAAAAQDERFSRTKHDHSYPGRAIDYCLRQAWLTAQDLDAVVYNEHPLLNFDRIFASAAGEADSGGRMYLWAVLPRWFAEGKFDPGARDARELGIPMPPEPGSVEERSLRYANIAANACTEEIICHTAIKAVERTGLPDLCLGGGVALNSMANGKLTRLLGGGVYVHPASDDSGCALGAALVFQHASGGRRTAPVSDVAFGQEYPEVEVLDLLLRQGITSF